jgi:hypothetical protein
MILNVVTTDLTVARVYLTSRLLSLSDVTLCPSQTNSL